MKKTCIAVSVIFLAVFLPSLCRGTSPSSALIDDVVNRVELSLKKIDSDMARCARAVEKDLRESTGKRQALRELCSGKTYAVDCVFINARGIMETIEPEKYRKYEGKDIKDQETVRRMHKNRQPIFSQIFIAVEGLQGIVFEYPVFNANKKFAGSVSLFVMPEVFVREAVKDLKIETGAGIDIVEPSGVIVYSTEPEQIRLNVLTSPQYKGFNQLKDMGRQIIAEKEGTGTYRYMKPGTDTVVKKSAVWKSVSFYDNFWRVVITTEVHRP